jgi:hypothetical protein
MLLILYEDFIADIDMADLVFWVVTPEKHTASTLKGSLGKHTSSIFKAEGLLQMGIRWSSEILLSTYIVTALQPRGQTWLVNCTTYEHA